MHIWCLAPIFVSALKDRFPTPPTLIGRQGISLTPIRRRKLCPSAEKGIEEAGNFSNPTMAY
jgi:hypothetical protein